MFLEFTCMHVDSSAVLWLMLILFCYFQCCCAGDGDVFHPEKRTGSLNLFQSSSTTRSQRRWKVSSCYFPLPLFCFCDRPLLNFDGQANCRLYCWRPSFGVFRSQSAVFNGGRFFTILSFSNQPVRTGSIGMACLRSGLLLLIIQCRWPSEF